ncbi:nucleoside diphosphate kinase regulator [Desulfobulbus sp.]|uniref:nucleoside diphosphate kinase regulator n=1 Tax=Desulfobulbus sp. TaxID=895 RepID=UPI00286F3321|nr:nucleoside diphosphate kinase regulator [Desulfobulbus sp.]
MKKKEAAKPNIIISTLDAERLGTLLEALPANSFPCRDELEEELDRAEIRDPKDMPPNVVTMNSTVRFRIAPSQEEFCLKLVYPQHMDDKGGAVSILAPVGSALLGLSQGDEIEWPKPGGGVLRVRIEEVTYQPERSGDFHL